MGAEEQGGDGKHAAVLAEVEIQQKTPRVVGGSVVRDDAVADHFVGSSDLQRADLVVVLASAEEGVQSAQREGVLRKDDAAVVVVELYSWQEAAEPHLVLAVQD